MASQKQQYTILYGRLSQEDERAGESNSIQHHDTISERTDCRGASCKTGNRICRADSKLDSICFAIKQKSQLILSKQQALEDYDALWEMLEAYFETIKKFFYTFAEKPYFCPIL